MLRGGGTSKTYEGVHGGGGPKIDEIEHTYFLNDSQSSVFCYFIIIASIVLLFSFHVFQI